MKKTLLLTAALVIAASGFAQKVDRSERVRVQKALPMRMVQHQIANKDVVTNGPKKAVTDDLWYSRPKGCLWTAWDYTGRGYYMSLGIVPPYTDAVFTDESAAQEGHNWMIEYWDSDTNALAECTLDEYGYDQDENGYPMMTPAPGEWWNVPALYNKDQSVRFSLTDMSIYPNYSSTYAKYRTRVGTDTLSMLTPVDDHAFEMWEGRMVSNSNTWGALSTDNLYGTGTWTNSAGTQTSYALTQRMGVTSSPLYVERVFLKALSSSSNPIPEGVTLTCKICKTRKITFSDNTIGYLADEDEVLEVLTAESGDTIDFQTTGTRNSKTVYDGYVLFTKKVEGPMGMEEEPITIPADTDWSILIEGFDQKGVSLGAYGLTIPEADGKYAVEGYGISTDGYLLSYTSAILGVYVGVEGMYDYIEPLETVYDSEETEYTGMNKMVVPAEGGEAYTEGHEGATEIYNLAYLHTAFAFWDEDEIPNYSMKYDEEAEEELPEWLSLTDDAIYDMGNNMYALPFTAEALPSDAKVTVNGEERNARYAVITLTGRGYEAQTPIIIAQGNITCDEALAAAIAAGINDVKNDNKTNNKHTYSISGQRVNKNFKGLVIKDGKKFINK